MAVTAVVQAPTASWSPGESAVCRSWVTVRLVVVKACTALVMHDAHTKLLYSSLSVATRVAVGITMVGVPAMLTALLT